MSSIHKDTEAAQNKQLFTQRFYENSQLKGKQGGILLKQAARLNKPGPAQVGAISKAQK